MNKKTIDGFGKLRGEQSCVPVFASIDIQFIYEAGGKIPAMFLDQKIMSSTMEEMGLKPASKKLGSLSPHNAVLYEGFYKKTQHWLSLLFVRARWSSYRQAIIMKNQSNRFITDKLCSHIHADHVLFRGSLKKEIYNTCDPWMLLVEVPAEANSGFGRLVERHLPSLQSATTAPVTWLTPLQLFKIFCIDMPANNQDIHTIMKNLKSRLAYDVKLYNEIESSIKTTFPDYGCLK